MLLPLSKTLKDKARKMGGEVIEPADRRLARYASMMKANGEAQQKALREKRRPVKLNS